MKKPIAITFALILLPLAGCGPSVTVEHVPPPDDVELVSVRLDMPIPGCLCPAPQACDPESAGACRCPDAPADVEAACNEGERVAMCGDLIPPACHRAPMSSAERVVCCQD